MSCKKYVERKGLYTTDFGSIGVPRNFLRDVFGPFDILLYGMPTKFKTNDMILVYATDEKNNINSFHMKVVGFSPIGGIEVEYLESHKRIFISNNFIIARLLKVIDIEDKLWHELIYELTTEYELTSTLERMIDQVNKAPDYPDKTKQLEELKRRLTIVTSGTN